MATTLGGATLADPAAGTDGHVVTTRDIGSEMDMADGSLRYDHIGTRKHFALRWQGITSAQVATIYGKYGVRTVQAYSPPESASSFNVIVVRDSWREESITLSDGTFVYNCAMELEEQSAS